MRRSMATKKPSPKCTKCGVRVRGIHAPECPRRQRTPMTVEYSDCIPQSTKEKK